MPRKINIDEETSISPYDYYKFYIRNSRLFGLVWFFLTLCVTLGVILVFIQPNWVGDTIESPNRGYFGLYRFCIRTVLGFEYYCFGTWTNFETLPNSPALKASTVFIEICILLLFICIALYFLCICIKCERIFHICAWLQFICGRVKIINSNNVYKLIVFYFIAILLFLTVIVFPAGWNILFVRTLCGSETDQYKIGSCEVKWPYIVACILVFNLLFLSILGFLLAARQAKYLLLYTEDGRYIYSSQRPKGAFF